MRTRSNVARDANKSASFVSEFEMVIVCLFESSGIWRRGKFFEFCLGKVYVGAGNAVGVRYFVPGWHWLSCGAGQ